MQIGNKKNQHEYNPAFAFQNEITDVFCSTSSTGQKGIVCRLHMDIFLQY